MSDQKQRDDENSLSRNIGLLGGIAIGLGTMMGAGIFVLSAEAASQAGPGATITFLLAGLIMLPIAMVLSELVTAMPQEGGSYFMISRVLGPLAGGVVGPANWIGLIFATGFYLIGFAQYTQLFIGIPFWVVTVIAGVSLTLMNYMGAKITGLVEAIIVGLLLLILLFFIISGLPNIEPQHHDPFLPEGWGGVVGAVGLIIVSFTGFEKVSTLAEEIKNPMKNLPRAIIGSVIIATLIYVGVLYVMTGVLPYQHFEGNEIPLVETAHEYLGLFGNIMMASAGLLATLSSINAAIMSSSRISLAMGRDIMIPSWFARIHPKHHTPHNAILVTGGAATALSLVGDPYLLAEVGSALFMVSYALLTLGIILINRKRPDWYKPAFNVPLKPWLPAAAGGVALLVILTMDTFSQVAGVGLAMVSLVWYFAWARNRTKVRGDVSHFH
jgi:basic amino acid/polyamine antiporter, APA family